MGGNLPYSGHPGGRPGSDYGGEYSYSRQQQQEMHQRMDTAEYPPYREGQHYTRQLGNDPRSMAGAPISRVASDPVNRMPHYSESSGHNNPRDYGPQGSYPPDNRGYSYQPASGAGRGGGGYGHQPDPSGRQPDSRFPHDDYSSYQSHRQAPNYPPGRSPNRNYGKEDWSNRYTSGQPNAIPGPDPSYQPSGGFMPTGPAGGNIDVPDVATPVAPHQPWIANRQQSASSLSSETSSSSDFTLMMRPPSIPPVGEVDTLREDDLVAGSGLDKTGSAPSPEGTGGGASTGDGLQTGDSQGPGTQDSEGPQGVIYVSDDDDNESLVVNDDVVRPYVKFGEQFPVNLSWHDIPLVKN